MNEEQELRARLEAVDAPPSRIQVNGLVRAGRRRAFRRRSIQATGGVAVATAMLLAAPAILTGAGAEPGRPEVAGTAGALAGAPASVGPTGSAAPPGPCRMTELPAPAGMKRAQATAVDPTGRYIVGHSFAGQNFRPILWAGGQPRALPMRGKSVQLTDVNASGVAVGLVTDTSNHEYVVRYENGEYTRLQPPPGSGQQYPTPSINAAGDVIINAKSSGNRGEGGASSLLLWKAGSTTAVTLPLPAGADAFEITDNGTMVGGTYKNGRGVAAYAWDQRGNGRKLEVPAGQTTMAYAARGDWATGGLWPSMSTALWNLKTGEVTTVGKPGSGERSRDSQGPGQAVNAAGWVVASDGSLLRGDGVVQLAVPTGQTARAADISDTGLVVGHARTEGLHWEVVGPRVWRC